MHTVTVELNDDEYKFLQAFQKLNPNSLLDEATALKTILDYGINATLLVSKIISEAITIDKPQGAKP